MSKSCRSLPQWLTISLTMSVCVIGLLIGAPDNARASIPGSPVQMAFVASPWSNWGGTQQPAQPSTTTSDWLMIPDWLAGTWQAKSEIVLQAYDWTSRRMVVDKPLKVSIYRESSLGTQCDRNGRVWHYAATPYKRMIEAQKFCECQEVSSVTVVHSGPYELSLRTSAIVMRFDKHSGELSDLFREQTLTTYKRLDNNQILTMFRIDDYDMQGNPTFSSNAVCTEKRIKPFHTVDKDERGELKKKFLEFEQIYLK